MTMAIGKENVTIIGNGHVKFVVLRVAKVISLTIHTNIALSRIVLSHKIPIISMENGMTVGHTPTFRLA